MKVIITLEDIIGIIFAIIAIIYCFYLYIKDKLDKKKRSYYASLTSTTLFPL